jgi:TPR repeat protein/peptidoglycan hydrolase-like protein with peptidoglycan-binding domain
MSGRRSVGALASVTIVAMAASVLLAFATIDPPPLPVKQKKIQAVATPIPAIAVTPVATAPAPPPAKAPAPAPTGKPTDWQTIAMDELRARANKNEIPAMEELGRRLLQGLDMPKDPQAGAGWLLRAAGRGSVQSAFNVAVMYERGFVVERDSSKAAEWYRKAADAGLPTAKHNLALLLRDGKGTARDVKAATQLLLSAAHQGMAASMFMLGDIYEQGDGGTKDPAAALAWFAITGEFERQANHEAESALAKTASQRAQVLKRTLTTTELERAQELAQGEFKRIIAELTPPPPPAPVVASAPPAAPAPAEEVTVDWPKGAADQIRAIQQALLELKRLRDKPDGNLGTNTRTAIRDFQKSIGMRQTGEPSRDLYLALVSARHDMLRDSPLPMPPQVASAPPESPKIDPPKIEPLKPQPAPPPPVVIPAPPPAPKVDDSKITPLRVDPPPPPPSSAEIAAKAEPAPTPQKADPPKPPPVVVDTAKPTPAKIEAIRPSLSPADVATAPAPPPPTSADIAKAGPPAPESPKVETAKVEPAKADPNAWPASRLDQVKAIQTLLRDLRFYTKTIDGQANGGTQTAIREYQRMSGLKETGEANKALFDSLKEMRKLMAPARN